ncbi:MAG: hypothetical protein K6G26_13550 [Lachnospiraceae bacterium]|nr:hypothetical protein [Lachnospiraceae bacterium]
MNQIEMLYKKFVHYLFNNYDVVQIGFDGEDYDFKEMFEDKIINKFTSEYKTCFEIREYFLRFESFTDLFYTLWLGSVKFIKNEKVVNIFSGYPEQMEPVKIYYNEIDDSIKEIIEKYTSTQY